MATKQRTAAKDVDRQLKRYRSMRDFDVSAEPRGGKSKGRSSGLPFVIQKHDASRLHYDFRLGWHGVLKSWAVAKGPSLDPADKRLAVEVEDHPIEYGGFEGTIPKGQYGGGTVMVWDQGEWSPEGDAEAGFKKGHIKFELNGAKLKGNWALVRMKPRNGRSDKPNWLLIKERDRFARTGKAAVITEREQDSAVTGRSIDEIAKNNDHVWDSNRDGNQNRDKQQAREAQARQQKRGEKLKRASVSARRDGLIRQASFKGLREDKVAKEVVREGPRRSQTGSRHPVSRMETKKAPPDRRAKRPTSRRDSAKESQMPAITHPEKIIDKASGLTKEMLAEYFEASADHMLPHVADRPLSVVRCPAGSEKPCFFQKHVGQGMPAGVKSVAIKNKKTGAKEDFLTVDSAQGLVGLAQMGVLEIHPWGSRNESLEKPDRIILDLDPDPAIPWRSLAKAALEVRQKFSEAGLESFLKSTGGKGLHVVAPIVPQHDWKTVKEFTHQLVLQLEGEKPEAYITKMAKASRKGKIFLDYLRNDRGATAVAAYSPRARRGAPVALPLSWQALKGSSLEHFSVADFSHWQQRLKRDAWAKMNEIHQELSVSALRSVGN